MRRCVLWSGLVALLAGAALSTGAPLDTKTRAVEGKLDGYAEQVYERTFEAGKTARVVAVGKGTGYIGLYVFDRDGNCVASDDDVLRRTRDDAYVEWIPPRAGPYVIEVKSLSRAKNEFLMTVRQ